jgi:hypothetical protein
MLRENVRLHYPFRITAGNRAEICGSYLHREGMKLPAVVAELATVYYEDVFNEDRVKYWLYEIA